VHIAPLAIRSFMIRKSALPLKYSIHAEESIKNRLIVLSRRSDRYLQRVCRNNSSALLA
jgi:hypothetical protein